MRGFMGVLPGSGQAEQIGSRKWSGTLKRTSPPQASWISALKKRDRRAWAWLSGAEASQAEAQCLLPLKGSRPPRRADPGRCRDVRPRERNGDVIVDTG